MPVAVAGPLGRAGVGDAAGVARLSVCPQVGVEMEVPELFATAVPEEQLESGWDRAQALRRLFGPSQCLRSVESPSGVGSLPAIVQGRMQEQ